MTTERNIIIHAGQTFTLSLDYAGTAGRGQRMHIRASDAASDVIAILTHNGDANARVIYDGTDSLDITIGASVNGGWLVGANRVEWVYDIEDYDLSDTDDVVIAYRGKAIVYGNRTRPEDVTPSAALPSGDGRYVRFDGVQGLTDAQKLQARENIGAGTGGSGSGDVVGPASATDDRIAAFDGTTGKLIKQGSVTATAVASHLSSTSNPHSVTAAQVGADPAGTASTAVSTHAGAVDPHGDRAYADGLAGNYATAAQGALADSAVQDVAAEIHAATADSIADADESGFWQSASSALRKITWANIKSTVKTYTDTLYAALGHGHANTDVSGLGGAATLNVGTTAGTVAAGDDARLTDDRTASSLRSATTVVSVSAATAPSSGQVLTATSSTAATWQTPSGGSPGGSSGQLQFNDASAFGGANLWRIDANTMERVNGTNTQFDYFYKTKTDGSNYERLAILPGAASGWMQIAVQTAGTGADNIGIALTPAGTGALSAHVPDSTSTGGNARGTYAVDFQMVRTAATQACTGNYSVICGGSGNTNTASYGTIVGGLSNTAAGGGYSVTGGRSNNCSSIYGVAFGFTNTCTGNVCTTFGAENVASSDYGWVPGGYKATQRALYGAHAWASGYFAAVGDAQHIGMILRTTTTATSAAELTANAAAVGSNNVMVLPNNSSHHFVARVTARNTASVGSGSWRIEGTIERGANAASTALVGATTITAFGISASLGAPTVDVIANTTQGAASVQVTPANTDSTKWVAEIVLIQVA